MSSDLTNQVVALFLNTLGQIDKHGGTVTFEVSMQHRAYVTVSSKKPKDFGDKLVQEIGNRAPDRTEVV